MLTPKVGDKVTIEGTVLQVSLADKSFRYNSEDVTSWSQPTAFGRITKLEAGHPKVGDTVWWDIGYSPDSSMVLYHPCNYNGCKLLFVHQNPGDDRKWAIVAFEGDIPCSIPYNCIRTTRE